MQQRKGYSVDFMGNDRDVVDSFRFGDGAGKARVSAAYIVYRSNRRMLPQHSEHFLVGAVRVVFPMGLRGQNHLWKPVSKRGPEADFPVLVASERVIAENDPHACRPVSKRAADDERRRLAGCAVVDADKRVARVRSEIRDHRDDGFSGTPQLGKARPHPAGVLDGDDQRAVRGLGELVDSLENRVLVLLEHVVEAAPCRKVGRHGVPALLRHSAAEAQHGVERPASEPARGVRFGQALHRGLHGGSRARAHAVPVVQDPVHGCPRHARFESDLLDFDPPHAAALRSRSAAEFDTASKYIIVNRIQLHFLTACSLLMLNELVLLQYSSIQKQFAPICIIR